MTRRTSFGLNKCLRSPINRANIWFKINQKHIESIDYHCHSSSSQESVIPSSPSISTSSFSSDIAMKVSFQPALGFKTGRIMIPKIQPFYHSFYNFSGLLLSTTTNYLKKYLIATNLSFYDFIPLFLTRPT